MFNTKKEKRYKLKRLYVARVYMVINKRLKNFSCFSETYELTGHYQCTRIVYLNFWHTYFINPLTKEKYKISPDKIGDIFCDDSQIENISVHFDIPDEIFLRGDYLNLEEILKYSKELNEIIISKRVAT